MKHARQLYTLRSPGQPRLRRRWQDRCLISPSPELREKLKHEMDTIRSASSGLMANMLQVREVQPPGMNDGLIYPGDTFPLGTPVRVVREAALERAPIRGTVRVVVALAQFNDRMFALGQDHYEKLFFSLGVMPNGSVREYFREVTNDLVDIVGEVVGPYTLPKTMVEYANGASGTGIMQPNARSMALHTAQAANAQVDFAPYDNDSDGYVDAFIIVHAGQGAENTGNPNDIWSHKWVLSGGAMDADGTKIYAYLTVPEDSKIGVCCHELGHLLFGFPDLYDTDYSSEGVGNWCLMGGGSWNGGGDIPAHPSAWCKANQKWVTVNMVKSNALMDIQDVKSGFQVYRFWKDGAQGSEYFLVENRQRTRFDRMLPGDGLLVWHIDDTIASNADENHPKVALVQADSRNDLEVGSNRGDTGDPFPGSANNTSFTNLTNPHTKSYADVDTCVSLTEISASAETMTVRVAVTCSGNGAQETGWSIGRLLRDFFQRLKTAVFG